MSFDPDESRRGGARLPPVAPPPRKIGSVPPSDAHTHGHGAPNGYGHANGGPIHQVGHYGGPPSANPSLPQIGGPSQLPMVTVPSRRGSAAPPPPPRSRDPLNESITRVNSQPKDTQRDDPYGLAMTSPSGRPVAEPAAEPLDWEDEEESTHVFQSSAPPPPPSPRRSLPRIAPPPVPRSQLGSQNGYSNGFRADGGLAGARLDAPPPLSTVRLDTKSALDQPRPDIVAERTPSYHGPLASASGSPFFPPSPPIPSLSPSQATKIPSGGTPLPQRGFEAQRSFEGAGAVVSGAEEVVRDQPFVKLAQGNPYTATELAIRKPVLPAHLAAPPEPTASAKKWLIAAAAAALVSVVALVFFLMGRRPGGVEIDVRDASGASVPKAEVYIDGRKVCDATPCTVRDLDVGRYSVRVLVSNDAALEPQTADIQAGLIARVTFKLAPVQGTLVVATTAPGLHVFVDGTDRGPVPANLTDLTPGKHDIKLAGDRYQPFEKSIDVKAGETIDLGAPKLSVVKGRAVVSVKTEGVSIVLIRNDDASHPKALEGPFPRPIEVETSSGAWKLVAKKKGLPDFVAPIDFSDGIAEKEIVVDLNEKKEEKPVETLTAPTTPTPTPTPTPSPVAKNDPPKSDPPPRPDPPKQESGTGTLNINSIPASRVLLDGQPLGETPRTGVTVSAGTHTVTFIHSELGKKSVSVKVGPGETKTASARLRKD